MNKHTPSEASTQVPPHLSAALAEMCYLFVRPLLAQLDRLLDRRLVQTLLSLIQVILMHRHWNQGLLLSELGAYLTSPEHAPAGTKRISRLLHSSRWGQSLIEGFRLKRIKPGYYVHPRCCYAMDVCRKETPVQKEITPRHFVSCHRAHEISLRGVVKSRRETSTK